MFVFAPVVTVAASEPVPSIVMPPYDCCETPIDCCETPIEPTGEGLLVGVTHSSNDNVGQILRYFGAGVDFFPLTSADLNSLDRLSRFYAIFINCGSQGMVNSRVLRDFVYAGGIVYASDHAARVLRPAFPGVLEHSTASSQTVRGAEITHSTLAAHMRTDEIDVIFDMGSWYVLTELARDATIYIEGYIRGHGYRPLAMSFNHGRGTVFFTSFHNSAQSTGPMIDFIEYLVFRIKFIEADRALAERAARDGFLYSGALFGFFDDDGTADAFAYYFDSDEFQLMFEQQAGVSMRLTDPMGNVFVMDEAGEIFAAPGAAPLPPGMAVEGVEGGGVRVRGSAPGEWQFEIEAEDSDADEAFVIGIAQAPQSFITRAVFVQNLAELAGANLSAYRNVTPSFADVARNASYFAAVEWATRNGIVSGDGRGNFNPQSRLTREQMFVLLHGFGTSRGITFPANETLVFPDRASISSWARVAVAALHAAGLDITRADGRFNPQANVTVSESQNIFYQFFQMF